MKRNRNRAAFMAAGISTGDTRLLIKTSLSAGEKEVAVAGVVVCFL